MKMPLFATIGLFLISLSQLGAQEASAESSAEPAKTGKSTKKGNSKKKRQPALSLPVVVPFAELNTPEFQEDFPAMSLKSNGEPAFVYIANDGGADSLRLAAATSSDGKMESLGTLSARKSTTFISHASRSCPMDACSRSGHN